MILKNIKYIKMSHDLTHSQFNSMMDQETCEIFVLRYNPKKNTSHSDASIIYTKKNCGYYNKKEGQKCIVLWSGIDKEIFKTGIITKVSKVDYNTEFDNRLTDQEKKRFINKTVWKFNIQFKEFDIKITNKMKQVQYPSMVKI